MAMAVGVRTLQPAAGEARCGPDLGAAPMAPARVVGPSALALGSGFTAAPPAPLPGPPRRPRWWGEKGVRGGGMDPIGWGCPGVLRDHSPNILWVPTGPVTEGCDQTARHPLANAPAAGAG